MFSGGFRISSVSVCLMALVLLLASPSTVIAYDPGEVCKVEIVLTYYLCDSNADTTPDSDCTLDAQYIIAETPITFTLNSGTNSDALAILNEVGVKSELQLAPGKFKIAINGYLCTDNAVLAYEGAKDTLTTIDGTEEGISVEDITIVALDKETYVTQDGQNIDYNPIITAVSITNAIGKYGVATSFTFQAVDPGAVDGAGGLAVVEWYALTSSTLQASNFDAVTYDGQRCDRSDANSLETCTIEYTPSTPDAGNMDFTLTVTDDTANTDTISGYLAVDAAGTMTLGFDTYHTPYVDTISAHTALMSSSACNGAATCDGSVSGNEYTVGAATTEIAFGQVGLISLPITDIDIATGSNPLSDTTAITITALTVLKSLAESPEGGTAQDNTEITCQASDVDFAYLVSDAGDVRTVTAVWNPWQSTTGGATDYGELWCQFSFMATDSLGLNSQTVTYTVSAYGTKQLGGESVGQLPYFSVIFVSDNTPAASDVITLSVAYSDPDSNTVLTVAPPSGDPWATVGWTGDGSVGSETADCTSGCTRVITLTVDGSASGVHQLDLVLTDVADAGLTDVRALSFDVGASRNRRSGGGVSIKSTPIAIAIAGTTMQINHGDAFAVSSINSNTKTVLEFGAGGGSNSDGNTDKATPLTVGALVAAVVLAVGLVGVLVRTKQLVNRVDGSATTSRERSPSKVEAGEQFVQEIEFDNALPEHVANGHQVDAATLGFVTEI